MINNNLNIQKINVGICSNTYKVKLDDNQFVIQIYRGDFKYHAYKKKYIFDLIKSFTEINVPTVFVGENKKVSYLFTEECPGLLLRDIIKECTLNEREYIFEQLGRELAIIHTKVPTYNKFGWIYKNGLEESFDNFNAYLNHVLESNIFQTLKQNLSIVEFNSLSSLLLEKISIIKEMRTSALLWTDINQGNFIINRSNKGIIIYWLDPAASRFAPPEWDIANAKVHLCMSNDLDFNSFLKGYYNYLDINISNAIMMTIDCFLYLVKACDLALAYNANDLNLFYNPYDFWFKNKL